MVYRELNGRRAERCDVCGAADGTVKECYWPYTAESAASFDRWGSTKYGRGPGGQFYDICGDCRQVADKLRQQFTDQRGVRQLLRSAGSCRRTQEPRTASLGATPLHRVGPVV